MSWVRLDDGFADHPKIAQLDDRAFRIYVWSLCYSARHLTDGFVAHEALIGCPLVTRRYTADIAQARLIGARLWGRRKHGIQIRDYLEFNPSAAKVKEKRAGAAERQQRWRDNQEKRARRARTGVTEQSRNAHPDPAPKAGEADAPLGAPLPLDDCMRCGERRPLRLSNDIFVCQECL
jgi:hypothetical protein